MGKAQQPGTSAFPIHVGDRDLLATDPQLWDTELPLSLQRQAMLNGAVAAACVVGFGALLAGQWIALSLAPLLLGMLTGYQWFRTWTQNVRLEERRTQAIQAVHRNMSVSTAMRRQQWSAVRDLVSCYRRFSLAEKNDDRLSRLTEEILTDLDELIEKGL